MLIRPWMSNPKGGLLQLDNAAALNLESGTYAKLGPVLVVPPLAAIVIPTDYMMAQGG